jgi:DNA-binding CsgD family transcriptional regulator
MGTALTGEIPLICREAELDPVLAALEGTVPAAFVLAGPAGVGKTRLASEVVKLAEARGFAVAHASGSRSTIPIPFGPFAPFLPESSQQSAGLLGLLRQAGGAIARRAGPNGKLLLIVDNAQHLDEGSAALVHQLVEQRTCGVLVVVRTPDPGLAGPQGQVPDLVTALWKDGLAERIDLAAFTEPETGKVIEAALGGPVSRSTVRRLWELSRGNALYLRELLAGAVGSGTLSETGGIWSLHRPIEAPGRLVELVASRLAGLAPETIALIELLAIGEPLGLSLLERLADPAGLEEAEAQGLVQVRKDGRRTEARLAHPLHGEVVRQGLPRSRHRRLAASLAVAIKEAGGRRREDLLRLGRWQLEVGGQGDHLLLTKASRRAQEMFDMDLAARLAQAALDSGGGIEAGLALGEAWFRSGRAADAEALLAGMAGHCQTDQERAQIASARAYNLHNQIGDTAAAAVVLDQALAVVTENQPRFQLLFRMATHKLWEGDPEGSIAAARPLLASDDNAIFSRASYVTSIALAMLGRGEQAASAGYAGLARHRETSGLPQLAESQLVGTAFGHIAAGRFDAAETDIANGQQASLAAGDTEGTTTFLFLTGLLMVERGHLGRAVSAFLDGASASRALNDLMPVRWCMAGMALAEAMSGHVAQAIVAAAERDALPVGSFLIFEYDLIDRSRAWVSARTGELSLASEMLATAAAAAAARQLWIAEARLRHDLARLGQPARVVTRLAELAELVEGDYVPALAKHASALATGSAAALEAAGQAFEQLGASLLAAEAYTAAARAFRTEGLARPASACARLAADLAAACGDVSTPGLTLDEAIERLTQREREIAAMAATGASNREIAAKLVLSVRTVDNHLQNAYGKLGVTSREDLAQALDGA